MTRKDPVRRLDGPVEIARQQVDLDASVSAARRQRWLERSLAIGIPIVGLVLWQVAARSGLIDDRLYPAPTTIVRAGRELITDGRLLSDIRVSAYRIVTGFALGAVAGLALGTAMGVSRTLRAALEPTLNAIYVVPKLALLPVFLTVFGFGEAPKLALVATTVFFFVWIETMEAMASVPDGFREAARAFGVSRLEMFRHALLPAALPQIFVALRVSMNVSVLVNTASEFIVGNDGLGYLIFNARALFAVERMYVGIVVVAVVGITLAAIVSVVGRILTPWHESRGRVFR